jgi:hypothetical protein
MLSTRAVPNVLLVLCLAFLASGCDLAGGIFKAGFWAGIFLVVLIAVGLMFLVTKMRS